MPLDFTIGSFTPSLLAGLSRQILLRAPHHDPADEQQRQRFAQRKLERALADLVRRDARLAATQVPLLMLVGEEDVLVPPARLDLYRTRFPHAQFHVVPNAGQFVYFEQPAAFNEIVLGFIEGIERGSQG